MCVFGNEPKYFCNLQDEYNLRDHDEKIVLLIQRLLFFMWVWHVQKRYCGFDEDPLNSLVDDYQHYSIQKLTTIINRDLSKSLCDSFI